MPHCVKKPGIARLLLVLTAASVALTSRSEDGPVGQASDRLHSRCEMLRSGGSMLEEHIGGLEREINSGEILRWEIKITCGPT